MATTERSEPPKGIEVVRHEPDDESYRSSGKPRAGLTLRWRWWRPSAFRTYATAAFLVALDLLLIVLFRYFIVEMEAWAPVIMMGLFAGLPLVFSHVNAIQYATSRTTLVASGEGLLVKWGPVWGGQRQIPIAEIGQLYVKEMRGRAVVVNLTPEGKAQLVAQHLDPSHARFVERELEQALALEDRPVEGELPRNDNLEAAVKRPVARPLLMGISAVAGIVVAGYFLSQPSQRTSGVSLLVGPAELTFEAEADEVATFWTATRAVSPIGTGSPRVQYLAGRVEVVIEVRRGSEAGAPVATLRCDPFGGSFFDWTSTEAGLSDTEYAFVGRMDECSVRLREPGMVFVRAEIARRDPEIRLERLELLAR